MFNKSTVYNLRLKDTLTGLQFLFVAFGALVLVPLLTGLNSSVALFTAGVGTLLFQLTTKGAIPPIFLASSFAFIAPITAGIATWGLSSTLCGLVAAGFFYIFLSIIIHFRGDKFLHKLLPPVVVGPVIITIGLLLSPVAVNMALGKSGDGLIILVAQDKAIIISMLSLLAVILSALIGKGWMKLVPVMFGIFTGYIVSLYFGIVDFSPIINSPWFAVPNFTMPTWNFDAILFMLPIAIAPAVEHVGDMLAISHVTGTDYIKKPGLKKTLLGDGIASVVASSLGGPPCTTYSEVTGAVALTKAYNPAIMTIASIFAIVIAFVGKVNGALQSVPVPVMGGIMLILFGFITAIGINSLIKAQVDLGNSRNVIIVAIILVFAIGGMNFNIGGVNFAGIGLGAIVGIVLNFVLPKGKHDLDI